MRLDKATILISVSCFYLRQYLRHLNTKGATVLTVTPSFLSVFLVRPTGFEPVTYGLEVCAYSCFTTF